MTTQVIQGKRCPKGQIERAGYTRKGYTKKDGTRVKPTKVPASCIKDRGTPGERSRGAKGGVFPNEEPWITHEGKLGGPGYTSKSAKERHKILDKCVKGKWGYRSCLGSIMVLLRNTEISAKVRKVLEADKKYLMDKYGGPGSFGPEKKKKANPEKETRALKSKLLK